MKKFMIWAFVAILSGVGVLCACTLSSTAAEIELPAPRTGGGMSLMEALSRRKSTRTFDTEKRLSNQQLADLLWAACGYNREDKLTIPTARNMQEISLYVIMPEGAYFYDNKNNKLVLVTDEDIRQHSGTQEFAQKAPLNIAIVSDKEKMPNDIFAGTDAGAVMQNIYLWCAANEVGTVTRGMFDGEALSKALKLKETERIILVQTVGY